MHADVYDAFAEAFVAHMAALRVGDPMDDGTDVGPLATEQGRDDVDEQVRDAVDQGARVLCGGERAGPRRLVLPADRGQPTSPRRCGCGRRRCSARSPGCTGSRRTRRRSKLANGTELRARLQRVDHATRTSRSAFATDLDAGAVFVNGMVTSYPELPFGGVKNSGYGRELSAHGIREFCNIKTVWVGENTGRAELTGAGSHSE